MTDVRGADNTPFVEASDLPGDTQAPNTDATATDIETAVNGLFTSLTEAPFGALSKLELESRLFDFFIATGRLDEDSSDFALAGRLRVSQARIRNLRYRLDQRLVNTQGIAAINRIPASSFVIAEGNGPDRVKVHFKRTYLKEYFFLRLLDSNAIADSALTPNVLEMDIFAFFQVAFEIYGTRTNEVSDEAWAQAWVRISSIYKSLEHPQSKGVQIVKTLTPFVAFAKPAVAGANELLKLIGTVQGLHLPQ